MTAGFDGYIPKPFYFDDFLETIKNYLESVKR
jgi:DNA-binding response OmpR family regulator